MTATMTQTAVDGVQLTTFHVGDLLLALPIDLVQEINRNLDTTPIPQAPNHIRGVINLRGEVATVIDLRRVLGLPATEVTSASRNLIVRTEDESVGLWVDQIADIISISKDSIASPPANLSGIDRRYFSGVHQSDGQIVVLLNVEEVLGHE